MRDEKDNLEQHLSGLQGLIQISNADIAFIKRECEGKVQELITQLDLSNKRKEALSSTLFEHLFSLICTLSKKYFSLIFTLSKKKSYKCPNSYLFPSQQHNCDKIHQLYSAIH